MLAIYFSSARVSSHSYILHSHLFSKARGFLDSRELPLLCLKKTMEKIMRPGPVIFVNYCIFTFFKTVLRFEPELLSRRNLDFDLPLRLCSSDAIIRFHRCIMQLFLSFRRCRRIVVALG